MEFTIYPHDTQECKLQMESCEFITIDLSSFQLFLFSVSHTTDDMIFQWDPEVPLVVGDDIELPQLALIKNYTADCTQVKFLRINFVGLPFIFRRFIQRVISRV